MATFDNAIGYILANESGNLLNDKATGEYSRYGITEKTALSCRVCTPANSKAYIDGLNVVTATDFYQKFIWPAMFSSIQNQNVATKLFDMVVNMGELQAIRLAQRACNALGATLSPDGRMGSATLAAINALNGPQLLLELCAETVAFYKKLCTDYPAKFGADWDGWKERGEKKPQ